MQALFTNPLFWLVIGAVIVVALSGVAAWYLLALRRLRQRQAGQMEILRAERDQQRQRLNNSIQVLAQGLLEEQLTLTEGAIRIRVLLDSLNISDDERESYRAFYLLATATDHIPILEQWKALSTKKKLELTRQREKLESDHREFVLDAAKRILGQQF
ncbi:DUF2489 domain-containing protein [Pseudomaricurvus sp. HS19]|uniref:DUF2489 domain-containing protein n=1 Tax=Pseudomaricurvus sp. HS19 TaxID=2692626 RepID=UPI001371E607|nr:DUF2489 domain-containing protein [Pseudomaricurvus sp. HS19]MYM62248.1 DUF2489 domain-containing protein [Pseudomaricurvus sp. HS19]